MSEHLDTLDFVVNSYEGKSIDPDDVDLVSVISILDIARSVFDLKNNPSSKISYSIKKGSCVHSFKSDKKTIIQAENKLKKNTSVQQKLKKVCHLYRLVVDVKSSLHKTSIVKFSPEDYKKESRGFWVSAGKIIRGRMMHAGGQDSIYIYIKNQQGLHKIRTTKAQVQSLKKNPLFHLFEAEVSYKMHSETGIEDPKSYTLNHLEPFVPADEDYLSHCIEIGTKKWEGISGQVWLENLRYGKTNTT